MLKCRRIGVVVFRSNWHLTASVVEAITNTDYAGEIENFGDTVNIIKEPTISVSAYSRGAVVDTQDIVDDQIQLVVDQANAFSFKVDDIEERHSHVNFESIATSSGAYALKNEYDKNVIAAMVAGVSSSSPDHLLGADSGSGQDQDVGFGSSEVDPVDTISKHNRLLNAADVVSQVVYTNHASLGLTGACCPTIEGTMLGCCG